MNVESSKISSNLTLQRQQHKKRWKFLHPPIIKIIKIKVMEKEMLHFKSFSDYKISLFISKTVTNDIKTKIWLCIGAQQIIIMMDSKQII